MFRKVILAAAAITILAGASAIAPVTAEAAMTCKEAAEMKYPDDRKMRRAFHKDCKEAYKGSVGKTGVLGKFKFLDRS
jgi:hypothetical protein